MKNIPRRKLYILRAIIAPLILILLLAIVTMSYFWMPKKNTTPQSSSLPTQSMPVPKSQDIGIRSLSQNPFGLHAIGTNIDDINTLRADVRLMVRQGRLMNNLSESVERLDQGIAALHGENMITLVSSTNTVGFDRYPLPSGKQLEAWKTVVEHLVDRYANGGGTCIVLAPDCYIRGDGLSPSHELRRVLAANPIHVWQIENEWLWQPLDPATRSSVSAEAMAEYVRDISAVIRKADPSAKIVLSGMTSMSLQALRDGYPITVTYTGDPDCKARRVDLANLSPEDQKALLHARQRIIDLLRLAAGAYDIVDIHAYGENSEAIGIEVQWMRDQLKALNLGELPIWSTETSSPLYFFPRLNQPQPTDCSMNIEDPLMQASDLVKLYAHGLSAGADKMFYSGLLPQNEASTTYQRLSLIDQQGNKKPAYHTYSLMVRMLQGTNAIEKLSPGVYRFTFPEKPPVYVMWGPEGTATIDASQWMGNGSVTVTPAASLTIGEPITSSASAIAVGDIPVFVTTTSR